ncbi:MAG: LAGLIDADG family homing endonuclease [Candidatus Woesearchaeota archaeon]
MTLPPEKRRFFRKLYGEGLSMRAIARREEVAVATIKKYLLLSGVEVRERNIVRHLVCDDERLIGTYCGLWAGDGSQYYDKGYRVKFCLHSGNKELIKFVQLVLRKLFGKESRFTHDHGKYSGFVIFSSRFIFEFVKEYLTYKRYKTKTVRLKRDVNRYSFAFLEGFFLGLMLSDGHLRHKVQYNSISAGLIANVIEVLWLFGITGPLSISDRSKYGWNDLFCLSLGKKQTLEAEMLLDETLRKIGYGKPFRELKGVFR